MLLQANEQNNGNGEDGHKFIMKVSPNNMIHEEELIKITGGIEEEINKKIKKTTNFQELNKMINKRKGEVMFKELNKRTKEASEKLSDDFPKIKEWIVRNVDKVPESRRL